MTTKVAIIGCGCIADGGHIPAYLNCEDAEIKYFCDNVLEKAQAEVDRHGCGIAITDYKTILEDDEVEAVSVCTPNLMHSTIAIDCLRAGKHVLCEKPAARVYSEALEMQKVQHETGKVLSIGVVNRFHGAVNKVRDMILSGAIGDVYHVVANFRAQRSIPGLGGAFTTKAIAGGGTLIDWGVHRLDIIMYCTGDPTPVSASGKAYCKLGADMKNYVYEYMWSENTKNLDGTYDVDDFVTAFIRTSGPTITLNGAWAQNIGVHEDYIDFLGTKAGIRLTYGGGFKVFGTTSFGTLCCDEPAYDQKSMFQSEIDSFIKCVREGGTNAAHIDNAILTSQIMQGIYDSSESGKEIIF